MTLSFIIFWLVCSIIAYSMALAHFQQEFPTLAKEFFRGDVGWALFMAIWGPVGIGVALASGARGWGFQFWKKAYFRTRKAE